MLFGLSHSIHFVYSCLFFELLQYDRVWRMYVHFQCESHKTFKVKNINLWIRALYTVRCTITTIRLSQQVFMRYVLNVVRYSFFFLLHLNLSQVSAYVPHCFCSGFQWNGTQRQKLCVQIEFDPLHWINVWVRRQNEIINVENTWDLNEKKQKQNIFQSVAIRINFVIILWCW